VFDRFSVVHIKNKPDIDRTRGQNVIALLER
jgi:hypothetical protein